MLNKFFNFIYQNKILFILILTGIIIRLFFIFLFNATHDFYYILSLAKSVADTGDVSGAFYAMLRHNWLTQLFGKIYYQIIAAWLLLLNLLRVINIDYLFDVKPYTDPQSYLVGLFQWGIPLHQMMLFKSIQFLFDGILLFSLYSIAKIIQPNKKLYVVLFWAITPFLMIVPYVEFQSDLSIAAIMTMGTLFWIKSLQNTTHKIITKYSLLTILCFVSGAIIKQVPLLILPFILISYSRNIKTFFVNLLLIVGSYILISQPWASDASLIKHFFLLSEESTAIFKFELNGLSVFLLLYIIFLYFSFIRKKITFSQPINLILINLVVLSIVYLTDDTSLLFGQFMIWSLPFLALTSLSINEYSLLLLGPILGNYKRIMTNTDLSHMLNPTFGYSYSLIPQYQQLLSHYLNINLFGIVIWGSMGLVLIYTILCGIIDIFQIKSLNHLRFSSINENVNLKIITIIIFIGFWLLFGFDFIVKSRFTLLPTQNIEKQNEKIKITEKPLTVIVNNPNKREVTAIELQAERENLSIPSQTIIEFKDMSNNMILKQFFDDLYFSKINSTIIIPLQKSISHSKFSIQIYKVQVNNVVYINKIKQINQIIGENYYDKPAKNEQVYLQFPKDQYNILLRGQININIILRSLGLHIKQRPKFYFAYFSLIGLIFITILILSLYKKINEK